MTPSLLIAAAQATDTVFVQPARDGLATAALVANLVLTGAFVLVGLGLAVLLFQLRGIQKTVSALLGRMETKLEPVLDRAKDVSANVEFITSAVRTDVQRMSDSVRSLSDRLQLASNRMEQRIEEFNALMQVVQSEAEDLFIGSAATLRGVRAGARTLRGSAEPALDDDAERLDEAEPLAAETASAPGAAPGSVPVTGIPQAGASGGTRGQRTGGGRAES